MLERLSITNNSAKFPQKCSIQLKLAINRLRLHRTKKLEEGNRHKKEIADLLKGEKEQLARVKTVSVIFEDYMIEALNMVEVYCETIISRAQLLSAQKTCPHELKDAVANVIYCAPYLAMEELAKLRKAFIKRYGKDFPIDCERNGCINEKLVSRLQHNPPEEALINYYLSAIAKKHNIDWEVPVGMVPTSIPTAQPGAQQPQFPTYGYPPMGGQPQQPQQHPPQQQQQQQQPTSPPHHAPPSTVYYPAPGQFPTSPAGPSSQFSHGTQGGGGFPSMPSRDDDSGVDDLEARFRALSGQTTSGQVQNPHPMPDYLDELDSMWKQSATEARTVGPALAKVDAVLAELDASARAVSAGGLLASKPAPSNDDATAALAAAVEALRQATSGLSSEAANGRPIGDRASAFAQAVANLAHLSLAAAAHLPTPEAQAAALRAIRASVESGRVLVAAAEAAGTAPHDPSLRDRLGQASAGVAAAVKSLLFIHQQPPKPQQPSQPPAQQQYSADEAARAEIMKAAQALIAAATQLHEASTGAPRQPSAGARPAGGGGWEGMAEDLGSLPPALIPPAQHIAGAAGALLAAAAECQAERVKSMSSGPQYHADPAWTDGLVSASRAVTSTTFHALKLAVAVGKGEADVPTLQAALRAASAASAQLVSASRAKADPSSRSLQALVDASQGLNQATSRLVDAATSLRPATPDSGRPTSGAPRPHAAEGTLTQTQAEEIEQRARILRLEAELDKARGDLHGMRKQRYQGGPDGGRPS